MGQRIVVHIAKVQQVINGTPPRDRKRVAGPIADSASNGVSASL